MHIRYLLFLVPLVLTPSLLPAQQVRAPLADSALALVPAVQRALTFAEWRKLYPTDSVQWNASHSMSGLNDHWCAEVSGSLVTSNGSAVRRRAYFYVPHRRGAEGLPSVAAAKRENCLLGGILLLGPTSDQPTARAFARADSLRLASALPPLQATTVWEENVARGWLFTPFWQRDSVRVASVASKVDSLHYHPVITLSTWVARSDLEWRIIARIRQEKPVVPTRPALLDTLIGLAGIAGSEATALRSLADDAFGSPLKDTSYSAAKVRRVTDALTRVLRPDAFRTTDEHVGRLLVAEWLIAPLSQTFIQSEWDGRDSARAALTRIGVTYVDDHLDDWLQDHVFLQRGLALGGRGPAAQRAFIYGLASGFELGAQCGGGKQIPNVIERGTAFLRDNPTSPVRGDVELAVGEAYSDLVALSSGAEYYGNSDSIKYAPQRESARAQALEHFRIGFRLAGTMPRAEKSWDAAWRLMAGLPPLHTFFYCVYD